MVPKSGKWVSKCDEQTGKWVVPPTHCDATSWTPQCNQMTVNGGYITCGHAANNYGQYKTECHLRCQSGFTPRDPNRTKYTCNTQSGAFSPQPIGCRPESLPTYPSKKLFFYSFSGFFYTDTWVHKTTCFPQRSF